MKTYAPKIIGKPSDYWVCPNCGKLNWYENEECNGEDFEQKYDSCGATNIRDGNSSNEEMDRDVLDWIDQQIKFYSEELKYTEEQIDQVEFNL